MKKHLRLAVLTAASLAALGTLATPGQAAMDTSQARVQQSNGRLELVYTGTALVNAVTVSRDASGATVVDDSVAITPGPGCQPGADATVVRCSAGVTRVVADLGSASDQFTSLIGLTGTVSGGEGFDTFHAGRAAGAASSIRYVGGNGGDTVSFEQATDRVVATLDNAANDGRPAVDGRAADTDNAEVEHLIGSRFGDTLSGNALPNQLTGNGGADTLRGFGGDDLLRAADGLRDLVLDCGDGPDRVAFDSGKEEPFLNCENRFPQ
ncbi:hypothetical protein [Nonomuraea sp. NPDC050310]|uniref:hypothetical protein n=1 Tax=unclassified Nonomuraea TaxID=2593643 RepID=UPI0033F92E93